MDKYKDWTREQLLEHIQELEKNANVTTDDTKKTSKKSRKQQRPFDMTKYRQRRIALKVAYLGWHYAGFAAQGDENNIPTVEGQLFHALEHCKLVDNRDSCDYTRCGRTDRGVSGLGQVIILNVRSKQLAIPANGSTETTNTNDQSGDHQIAYLPVEEELNYVDTLNRALPNDIRMLAWAPVAPHLNARFDCRSRTYRYLFRKDQLNLTLMQQAAHDFVGMHDFRNFCKLDPSKNISNYHRQILQCNITPYVSRTVSSSRSSTLSLDSASSHDMMRLELQGTAFLWHQVRCMMSVLFLVGQQLEPPTIVKDLLNITMYPARPDYPMASDLPLILYDCEFDSIVWHHSTPATQRAAMHWDQLSYAQHVRALTCDLFYSRTADEMTEISEERQDKRKPIVLGGGTSSLLTNYKPLANRPRCDTDAVKKEKYSARKRKRELLENQDQ